MEAVQPNGEERASKKPRVDVDSVQNGVLAMSLPELERINQSENQLAYLQAQLAATESLYAVYQAELQGLSKELGDVKRSHLQNGLPLWKDAGLVAEVAVAAQARLAWRQQQHQTQQLEQAQQQQTPSPGGPCWDDDLDTYSDIEEEVLLIQAEEEPAAVERRPSPDLQQQQHRQNTGAAAEGSSPPAAATDAAAAGGGGGPGDATAAAGPGSRSTQATGDCAGAGGGEGAGAATTERAAVAVAAGTGAATAATMTAVGATAGAAAGAPGVAAREGLEALEATCSAVAQEDMEAQGAVACLAGRTGKYYLRSTVVSLGRTTESKGEVDLDLTPEEPPPGPAPARGAPATAAGATGGGPGTTGPAGAGGPAAAAASPGAAAAAPAGATAGDQGADQAGAGGGANQAAPPVGRGHAVSRRQALIRLGADGQFRVVNTGRQAVVVNDVVVPQNHTVNLPHLSLLEVASVRLLFLANLAAVSRVVRRSAALSL